MRKCPSGTLTPWSPRNTVPRVSRWPIADAPPPAGFRGRPRGTRPASSWRMLRSFLVVLSLSAFGCAAPDEDPFVDREGTSVERARLDAGVVRLAPARWSFEERRMVPTMDPVVLYLDRETRFPETGTAAALVGDARFVAEVRGNEVVIALRHWEPGLAPPRDVVTVITCHKPTSENEIHWGTGIPLDGGSFAITPLANAVCTVDGRPPPAASFDP